MASLLACVIDVLFPVPFFAVSIFYFAVAFVKNPLLPLTNFASFKEKAFAGLWLTLGGISADQTPAELDGLLASSKGLILDVGPGSGDQLRRFSNPQNITAIYGVEPGVTMHDKLRESARKAGLGDDKYRIIGGTADLESIVPALVKDGLVKTGETGGPAAAEEDDLAIFDEIVCVRVLCGVPDQEASVADLYALLKPGGRFVLCEHVLNGHSWAADQAQKFWMAVGWQALMGGCDLRRDTVQTFLNVAKEKDGGFAKVEMNQVDAHSMLTHVVGVLTKKQKKKR
ncbi:hypothetical protein PV08_08149 [Exophiala spinifera]|uniref:Methyltransferase type 11 domain-containing protein n=1 Tax=Exophiala spinifera TaxID=91928 RepID=A0A0D1ZJG7_9EURO|nr:uncharacterized protein PV08_08149 [Exophiala spinifera]KIW12962.1 hypothetical protein PV08_08149 [Exophiala spinifera]